MTTQLFLRTSFIDLNKKTFFFRTLLFGFLLTIIPIIQKFLREKKEQKLLHTLGIYISITLMWISREREYERKKKENETEKR